MIKANVQKGFTLTEALVSFTIVAIGLLAVATFQGGLFKQSAHNKARGEALALAQEKIDQLKHYTLADETAYIDEDNDGVLDAVGNYSDAPINGQNAVFVRSWDLTATQFGREADVTVSWTDAENQTQSVSLAAEVPWIAPRGSADRLATPGSPLVHSPTGRARIGDGQLSDYPSEDLISYPNIHPEDGLLIYQYNNDLLLANSQGNVLLTLEEACSSTTGNCADFVRISGTVYLDTDNSSEDLEDILVLASDAAHCERYVPSGTLANPPATASGDYEYYNYTCYLGGGWHGNIGFVTTSGLQQRDKVCQGDPTAFNLWEQPVIALRRAYRGMIHNTVGGNTRYHSHGIKDATMIEGQDFVFTDLSVTSTEGYHCMLPDAPMTRDDSQSGTLFTDVPTDFVCLNADEDADGSPDYLDDYDTAQYGANTTCPFDPTSPPVQSHTISGTLTFTSTSDPSASQFTLLTSDGPGNCEFTEPTGSGGSYIATYTCTVFDWGSGWTGDVIIRPDYESFYCPSPEAPFAGLTTDSTHNFGCYETENVIISGSIEYLVNGGEISSMSIQDNDLGDYGHCDFIATAYECIAPSEDSDWDGSIFITSSKHVCGSSSGEIVFAGLSPDSNPHSVDLTIAQSSNKCP